jgi:hypothetical protein
MPIIEIGKLRRGRSVTIDDLHLDGEYANFNSRTFYDQAKVEGIRNSIIAGGLNAIPALTCIRRGTKYLIVDGWTRTKAIQSLIADGLLPQECLIAIDTLDHTLSDVEVRRLQIPYNSGTPLPPLDQGRLLYEYLEIAIAENPDFSEKTSRNALITYIQRVHFPSVTATTIANYLSLHELPEDLKALVASGEMSPSRALELSKDYGANAIPVFEEAKKAKAAGKPLKAADIKKAAADAGVEARAKRPRKSEGDEDSPKSCKEKMDMLKSIVLNCSFGSEGGISFMRFDCDEDKAEFIDLLEM